MVEKVIRFDDLDESPVAEPIIWMWEGRGLVIDLSPENKQKFYSAVQPYLEKSRPVQPPPAREYATRTRSPRRRTPGGGTAKRKDYAEIREWAKEQGMQVKDRGRISQDIVEAYDAAHSRSSQPPHVSVSSSSSAEEPTEPEPSD